MNEDDFTVKYSESPFAPDWARDPALRATKNADFSPSISKIDGANHLSNDREVDKKGETGNQTSSEEPFRPKVEQIEEILWQGADDDVRVYCIMDGYWAEGLYGRLLNSSDISWAHMFQGDVATRNVQQAPFIIALKRGHKLTRWLIEEGWGQGWGIYFTASSHKAQLLYGNPRIHDKRFLHSNEEQLKLGNLTQGPEDPLWKMRRHFRHFSDVYLESENKIVDFRYYDPSVFDVYIKSMDKDGTQQFLAPVVNAYYQEYIYSPLDPLLKIFTKITFLPKGEIRRELFDLIQRKKKSIHQILIPFLDKELSQKGFTQHVSLQQEVHFKKKEQAKYMRYIAAELSETYLKKNIFRSYIDLLNYVMESIVIARELNLCLKFDIENFIICRIHYGDNFYKKNNIIAQHLNNPARNTKIMDPYLIHWANAVKGK